MGKGRIGDWKGPIRPEEKNHVDAVSDTCCVPVCVIGGKLRIAMVNEGAALSVDVKTTDIARLARAPSPRSL